METIQTGEITDISENYRGWFIGPYVETHPELQNGNFELKWSDMAKGEASTPKKEIIPDISTLAILMRGKMEYNFLTEDKKFILEKEGDYVFFNPNYPHSCTALEDTLVLTIRWPTK